MKISIIGTGLIGGSLARRLSETEHEIYIANSRGPASLAALAKETGAKAVAAKKAASIGEIVFVAIPMKSVADLPKDLFNEAISDVVIVDTGNYYPRERDGRIDLIEDGLPESRWVAGQIGRSVFKAFNTLHWRSLLNEGVAAGAAGRIAVPVAGDDEVGKAKLIRLLDQLGFDGVDGGPLEQSWRQQPGTPVYAANLDAPGAIKALTKAVPNRKPEFSAVSK